MYFKNLDAPYLLKIAKSIFSQYQIWGRLLLDRKANESFITREDISEHLKQLSDFLYFLEKVAELRFNDKEIPILYNTNSWTSDLDLGGFNSIDKEITFAQVLPSYYSAWILQSDDKESGHNRFFKSVLWVCQNKGFDDAVLYMLLLQKGGYIIDSKLTEAILYYLFHAYQISSDNSEIINHFFNEKLPENQLEWFDASVYIDFDENAEKIRDIPENILFTLVKAGLDECEELRNAKSYNEFFLTQTNLKVYLDLIYKIIKNFVVEKSVFLIGILDQFEEIRADFLSIKYMESDYYYRWGMAESMLAMSRFYGEEFIYRLIEERTLIPYELTSHAINYRSFENVPNWWKELSLAISSKYLTVFFKKDFKTIWRKTFLTLQDIDDDFFIKVLSQYGIYDFSNGITPDFDKDFFIKAINLESVPVLEGVKNGFIFRSKKIDSEDKEFKDKYDRWEKEYLPLIKADIDKIYSSFCLEDFINRMENTWKDSNNNKKLEENLLALYDMYPCYPQSLVELAIFYDDRGKDSLKAFTYLENALVLDPINPLYWQSMGVTLKNLADIESSNLVFMYKDFLDQLFLNSHTES